MIKEGKMFDIFYTKIIRVASIVHAFHRITEQARGNYSKAYKIIANVKKYFVRLHIILIVLKKKLSLVLLPS